MSELKSVTNDEHIFAPMADFIKKANLNVEQVKALRLKAETNYTGFWSDLALEYKVMRRLLRSIAREEAITQDVSTLENPAILEQLQQKEY